MRGREGGWHQFHALHISIRHFSEASALAGEHLLTQVDEEEAAEFSDEHDGAVDRGALVLAADGPDLLSGGVGWQADLDFACDDVHDPNRKVGHREQHREGKEPAEGAVLAVDCLG